MSWMLRFRSSSLGKQCRMVCVLEPLRTGRLDEVFDSWLLSGPALALVTFWGVNQWICLCSYVFQINKPERENMQSHGRVMGDPPPEHKGDVFG